MIGLGLALPLALAAQGLADTTPWLLANGAWNDIGIWDDAAGWKDS